MWFAPKEESEASLAAEALQVRRRATARVNAVQANNAESPNNQWEGFVAHLELMREQLDRCLQGIAENSSSLKALRQELSVAVTQPRSLLNERVSRSSEERLPSRKSSHAITPSRTKDENDRMREVMKARRVEGGSSASMCPSMSHRPLVASDITFTPTSSNQRRRSRFAIQLWRVLSEPESSREAAWTSRVSFIVICISLILTIIDSGGAPISGLEPVVIQLACDSFFSLELIARFYACPSRIVFLGEVYTWCELAASFPILAARAYVHSDLPVAPDSWAYIVLVVFAPVLRLLMVLRRFEQIHLLVSAFQSAAEALPVMIYTLLTLILGFAAVLFVVEPRSNIASFADAIWLTMVTCYTVGYGDLLPASNLGKLVECLLMIFGALCMAIPIGIIGDAFSRVWVNRESILLMQRMSSRLKFAHIVARDIPTLFHAFDSDENGCISREEFLWIIEFMSVNLDDAQAMQLFNLIDTDGSGEITDEEFVKALFPRDFEKIYKSSSSALDGSKHMRLSDLDIPQDLNGPALESTPKESPERNALNIDDPRAQHEKPCEAAFAPMCETNSPNIEDGGFVDELCEDAAVLSPSMHKDRISWGAQPGLRDI